MHDSRHTQPRADDALLQRIAAGEGEAVAEFVDAYGGLVWSLAVRFTETEAEAEDAVQDIFLLLWRRADRYDPSRGGEATFVSLIARRFLVDRWRRRASKPPHVAYPPILEQRGVFPPDISDAVAEAVREFNKLDAEQQEVLRLALEHGCTHAEIAAITEMPIGTIKTRIRSGLRRIRAALGAPRGAASRPTGAAPAEPSRPASRPEGVEP